MSVEQFLLQHLYGLQKIIILCSAVFFLILALKLWRHSTILITLLAGIFVIFGGSFHTTSDVGLIIFGWWSLPLGYFMIYKSYWELLKIEGGITKEGRLIWLIVLALPIWLIFSILSQLIFSPFIILIYYVLPSLRNVLSIAIGIIGPFFLYYPYLKFLKHKLSLFPERESVNRSTYFLLYLGALSSIFLFIAEFYSFTLGVA